MLKKVKILLVIISLAVTLSLMSNTYSRYVAGTVGNLDMVFAKWQILVNDTDITNNTSSSINLVPVIEENSNVKSNTVAPSTKGYFDIEIDPSNADVSFQYQIQFQVENENMPDLMITKYSILDENYQEGDEVETIPLESNQLEGSLTYDNSDPAFQFKPFTIRVYFEWYEGENESMNDEADSQIGSQAAEEDIPLEITSTITFEQEI